MIRHTLICMAALSVIPLYSPAGDRPEAVADAVAIQGEWRIKYFEEQGEVDPPDRYKTMHYVFADGKVAIKIDGQVKAAGTLKLDPGKEPRHIDMDLGDGATVGIYKLEADQLTVCCTAFLGKTERPKEFRTQKGSGTMLLKLERVKK